MAKPGRKKKKIKVELEVRYVPLPSELEPAWHAGLALVVDLIVEQQQLHASGSNETPITPNVSTEVVHGQN
jgi:hypothetical protein